MKAKRRVRQLQEELGVDVRGLGGVVIIRYLGKEVVPQPNYNNPVLTDFMNRLSPAGEIDGKRVNSVVCSDWKAAVVYLEQFKLWRNEILTAIDFQERGNFTKNTPPSVVADYMEEQGYDTTLFRTIIATLGWK